MSEQGIPPTDAESALRVVLDGTERADLALLSLRIEYALSRAVAQVCFSVPVDRPDALSSFPPMLAGQTLAVLDGAGDQAVELFSGQISRHFLSIKAGSCFAQLSCTAPAPDSMGAALPSLSATMGENVLDFEGTAGGGATLLLPGHSAVKPGQTVAVQGFGVVFDGVHPVSRVALEWADSGVTTRLWYGEDGSSGSAGLTTSSDGLVLADGRGNSVTLGGRGISIVSTSDVQIKAAGLADVQALNVTLAADQSLKASGSASAQLIASGETSIKGAMVLIN
ncbi:MAG: hypothetical protein RLZZ271_1344 [Pseudomonadota bacterium]|jgi:hypothetical protein